MTIPWFSLPWLLLMCIILVPILYYSLCTVAENTVWGCLLRGGLSTTGGKINRSSETRLCNKFLLSFDLDETHKCYRCGGEIWTKWCYLGTCQVICQTPGEAFEALPWAKPWYNKEDWSVNKVGDRQPKTQGTRNFYFHFFFSHTYHHRRQRRRVLLSYSPADDCVLSLPPELCMRCSGFQTLTWYTYHPAIINFIHRPVEEYMKLYVA